MSRSLAIVLLLVSSESAAWGYRPFIATDAAVADPKEMEIELGYFTLERDRGKNTFIIPKVVLNYGFIRSDGEQSFRNMGSDRRAAGCTEI
jgi:hypothetical protein